MSVAQGAGDPHLIGGIDVRRYDAYAARRAALPARPMLVEGLLPVGVTVLAAGPKIGKSALALQLEHHLAYGLEVPQLPSRAAEERVQCLVIDLEGDVHQFQDHSLHLMPGGGDVPGLLWLYHEWGGLGFEERLEYLDLMLAASPQVKYVRLDTLKLFLGPRARDENAYDADASRLSRLDRLARRHEVAILALHHLKKSDAATNRSGDWVERISGSMGIAGSVSGLWLLERLRGGGEGLLHVTGRGLPEREYACSFSDRRWRFATGTRPEQVRHTGLTRAIVAQLAIEPMTHERLCAAMPEILPTTVRRLLNRLVQGGDVERVVYGEGSAAPVVLYGMPGVLPAVSPGADGGNVALVGEAVAVASHDQRVGHEQDEQREDQDRDDDHGQAHGSDPASGQHEGGQGADDDAGAEDEVADSHGGQDSAPRALEVLKSSIFASRAKPIACIPKDRREGEPWVMAAGASDGRHGWSAKDVPGGLEVVVLDRNGSYPSACSSVSVAANILRMDERPGLPRGRAGVAEVRILDRSALPEGLGHPLGQVGYRDEGIVLTKPGLDTLTKLKIPFEVVRSASGPSTTSLFEPFYEWVKDRRRVLGAEEQFAEQYERLKRDSSIAIRLLHPAGARSPFWRPDWHAAVLAEANSRHWWVAYRAVADGARCVAMRNVDEVAFAVPAGAPADWVPAPYRLDVERTRAFGLVKIKFRGRWGDWSERGDGLGAR